jgi:hypothetical protein
MDTPTLISDPVALVRQLDPDVIRERLAAMDRERRALLSLLRVATTVGRRPAAAPDPVAEVAHAS